MAHLQQAVPRTRRQRDPITAYAQARDPVVVPRQHADALALERVPAVDIIVVVTRKQHAPVNREGRRRDAAHDVVVRIRVELSVRAQIKQLAGGVVGSRDERVAVGEESAGQLRDRVAARTDQPATKAAGPFTPPRAPYTVLTSALAERKLIMAPTRSTLTKEKPTGQH